MEKFIAALMAQMTLDEKIGQLNLIAAGEAITGISMSQNAENKIVDDIAAGKVGGVFSLYGAEKIYAVQKIAVEKSRLHIPLLFGLDVIHGHKTIFPIPLGLSCTWNMPLLENTARIAALEASQEGIHWVFSPMVDITRDPRWGRCAEGAGEDAYLGGKIAAAMVRGYQHNGHYTAKGAVMACAKHFALYGAAEGGRDYNTTDMSRIQMYEYYFPPYKAAIDAGVGSIMTSFNTVDGVPATGNKWLLTDVLREEWGFDGLIVSDYTSVNEMTQHGLGNLKTVSALALNAGLDMDMVGEGFLTTLPQSLQEGTVNIERIDRACEKILQAKYKLGLFDNPYKNLEGDKTPEVILCPDHRAAARHAAAQSCVLLKNDNNILPLKKQGKIALVGPLADDQRNMPGTWSVAANWRDCVSILQGMKTVGGEDVVISYATGCNLSTDAALVQKANIFDEKLVPDPRAEDDLITEAIALAQQADTIVAVVGEAQEMSGEAASRTDITLPDTQKNLLRALSKTGKPLVIVFLSGRPLVLVEEIGYADALVAAWFGGTEAGHGVADILFGTVNPAGKITMSFPRAVGQIPVYYNHKKTGRPYHGDFPGAVTIENKFKSRYLDVENDPLFPFGFGLSYTTFHYGAITANKTRLRGNETLSVCATITNTGTRAGAEIVQLYMTDPVASISRAVKDLKGFQKIDLQAGESQQVVFEITPEDLKFYTSGLTHDWEAGAFIIHIVPHSAADNHLPIEWHK